MDASRVVASRKSRALGNPPERAPVTNNLTALKLVAQFVGKVVPSVAHLMSECASAVKP